MANNWIKKALAGPKSAGGLHRSLGIPQGQNIPTGQIQSASDQSGKTGRQARLALTLKGFKK